jgi:translation initiation factor 3 subunit F
VDLLTSPTNPSTPSADLDLLRSQLTSVLEMIDRVLTYVKAVNAGQQKGDTALGKYLLDIFNTSTKGFEKGFNTHLQDTLMMSYLANLVRSQSEVAGRLGLVTQER